MDRRFRAESVAMIPADLKPPGHGTWGRGLVVALDSMVSELFSILNGCAVLGVLCLLGSCRVKRVNEFPPAAGTGVGSVAFQFGEFQ